MINVGQIELGVRGWIFVLACLIEELPTGFPDALSHLDLWFCWFGLGRMKHFKNQNPKDQELVFHPCVNLHREK